MGIGVGLILVAAGAILTWALETDAEGINLNTVGIILMIVGVVGIILSLVFWSSWGSYGIRREETTVKSRPRDDRDI